MIRVNEIFGPTVQGEGKNAGMPVAFLRLANCNLHCFKCDTPFTWYFQGVGKKHKHIDVVEFDREAELHKKEVDEIVEILTKTGMKHLVISGGEPLMQQRQLIPLLQALKGLGWFIEVETNGTLVPKPEFVEWIDQINCSPKLEGEFSGESEEIRIVPKALEALIQTKKVNFKFVICEASDIKQVMALKERFGLDEIRLMPECRTNEEMKAKEKWVRFMAEKFDMIYCTRLSIEISGTKRGV